MNETVDFFSRLMSTEGWPPRWFCGHWTQFHGWLYILSDIAIWAAYTSIPLIILYFVMRRKDVPFLGIFWLFAAFIYACGITHLVDAMAFWWPAYRVNTAIRFATAIISWVTVFALVPTIPKILALKSPKALKREINEREQAEAALRQSQNQLQQLNEQLEQVVQKRTQELEDAKKRYHLLVDGIKDYAIFMLDPQGYIIQWNQGAERIFGYLSRDIMGRHYSYLHPPEYRQTGKSERILEIAATEGRFEEEAWRYQKDGTRFYANVIITPLYNSQGELIGFNDIIQDITARKQAEDVIKESEERFRLLTEGVKDYAIYLEDIHGNITSWNEGGQRIYGYTKEEILGKPFSFFLLEEDIENGLVERELAKAAKTGKFEAEGLRVRRDGTLFWASILLTALRDPAGELIGFSNITRDITEWKKASRELQESEARKSAILEGALDAIITIDQKGVVLEWNTAAEKIFQYTREEALGRELSLLIIPERYREAHIKGLKHFLSTGEGPVLEKRIELPAIRKDGAEFPSELSIVPISLEGTILFTGTLRDITERKQAEAALLQSEQQLADFFENAALGLHWVGPDGRILKANKAELALLGYSAEEYIGHHIAEFHVDQEVINDILKRLRSNEHLKDYPAQLRAKDGSIKHVLIDSSVYWQNNQFIHSRCFTKDITEQKAAQEALLESEQRFRTMADQAPVMIWMANLDALCTFFNQPWLDFTGRTLEQEQGNGWMHGVHPEDLEQCLQTYHAAFQHREEFKMEYRLRRFDGEYRWIINHGIPRYTSSQEFVGYIGSCIDCTDQKQAREELEKRVEERTSELVAVNKELEAFTYSVSHDLRAPLRSLDGFSQALLEDYGNHLDQTAQQHLHRIRANSQRMAQIIDDLLNLSRVSRTALNRETVNLSETAKEIMADFRHQEPHRQAEVKIADHLVAEADPRLLRLVLQNLLGNAWKFTQHRNLAYIELNRTTGENGQEIYFVQDNGAGFDMKYAGKLFGPFQRLHGMTEFPGTGIGLATVQRIIHRHGGEIWAESAVNQGATFFFTLTPTLSQGLTKPFTQTVVH